MKRCVAILLSMLLLLPCMVVAEEDSVSADPASNADYMLLEGLGLLADYDDGAFQLDETVSRAEFAMLMLCILGMDEIVAKPESARFFDVPASYWAANYIEVIVKMGFMNGVSDKLFDPEGEVTLEQAAKVLTMMAGFGILAENRGGYPTGYLTLAAEKGITKGVTNQVLTRADVLRLMTNVLEVDCFEQYVYGSGTIQFREGMTILERYHKIRKLEGKLVSTGEVSLYGAPLTHKNSVTINGSNYNTEEDCFPLLGQSVVYYVNEEDDIIYLMADRQNEVLVVPADDINRSETRITDSGSVRFVYEGEDGDRQEITLPQDAAYLINNRPYAPPFRLSYILPEDGQVKLVDGEGDGVYETVLVDNYYTMVALRVNQYEGFITDELEGRMLRDLTDADKTVKVIKNDREIKFSDIIEGNVLSVKESHDGTYIEIQVSEQTVAGTATEVNQERKELMVDDTLYQLSSGFDYDALQLGTPATYYMDVFGKLVGIDRGSQSVSGYAYLFGADLEGMGSRLKIKVLSEDGTVKILTSKADRISYNYSNTSVEEIYTALSDPAGGAKQQLIVIGTTEEGLLSSIKAGVEVSLDYPAAARSYSTAQQLFGMYEPEGFGINSNTKLFMIQETAEDSKIMQMSDLIDRTEYNTVEGYDGKETMVCSAVVIRPQSGSGGKVPFSYATPLGVIEGTYETVDAEGNPMQGLKINVKGATINLPVDEKAFATRISMPSDVQTTIPISELKIGDVVHYNLNMDGEIENIGRIFPYEKDGTPETETEFIAAHGYSRERVFGMVQRMAGDYLSLRVGDEYYTFVMGSANFTVYDYETKKCRQGSIDDLVSYESDPDAASRIFIKANTGVVEDVIIFQNY